MAQHYIGNPPPPPAELSDCVLKVKFLIEIVDFLLSGEAINLTAGLAKLVTHPYIPSFFLTHFLVLTLGKPCNFNVEGFSNSFLFSSTLDDNFVVVILIFCTELSTNGAGLAGGAITKPVFFSDPGIHMYADGVQDVDVNTDGGGAVSVHLYILSAAGAGAAAVIKGIL